MDAFYHLDNKDLMNFLETAKPLFEQMSERNDYQYLHSKSNKRS